MFLSGDDSVISIAKAACPNPTPATKTLLVFKNVDVDSYLTSYLFCFNIGSPDQEAILSDVIFESVNKFLPTEVINRKTSVY